MITGAKEYCLICCYNDSERSDGPVNRFITYRPAARLYIRAPCGRIIKKIDPQLTSAAVERNPKSVRSPPPAAA